MPRAEDSENGSFGLATPTLGARSWEQNSSDTTFGLELFIVVDELSNPASLKSTADSRLALRRLAHHERYQFLLELARRTGLESGTADAGLDAVITKADADRTALQGRAGGLVVARNRPKTGAHSDGRPPSVTVYLDECGSHTPRASEKYGAFVLAAIIVKDEAYLELNAGWKQWKNDTFGADVILHEPDLRRGQKAFWFDGDYVRRLAAVRSLSNKLDMMDFTAVASVVHLPGYLRYYKEGPVDAILPHNLYLMSLDFILERIVMILESMFGGAKARIIAESRGAKEDAVLQYEFVRLMLDGTSYISDAWFRHQLEPAITFRTKADNITGLQLADLMARPCGDKVLDPASTPERWPHFRTKLAPGQETAHSILGLKIFPWADDFDNLWTS